MIWDWAYAIEIFPELLDAFRVTIFVTLVSSGLSVLGGLFLALVRRVGPPLIAVPTAWFVEFVRGTPPFVQLLFMYFAMPSLGVMMSPMLIGIVVLSIHYSTYTSEVYRAGIESIDQGQWDAGRALNCRPFAQWRYVILPQVVPRIIPALGSYTILMFKDTPLLAVITVGEVLQRAEEVASLSYRYTEPLTIVGILFLVVSYLSSLILRLWERRVQVVI
jgi:polar amino acid transport system permease protein